MALIRIPEQQRTLADAESITSFLEPHGITYERWESKRQVPPEATADEVLAAYADKVDQLKTSGGYTAADVMKQLPSLFTERAKGEATGA